MTPYISPLTSTASLNDYWQLLKPRVMSLVIFTGWCGMVLAPGTLHPILQLTAILSLAAGAGGAGCLNMWVERHRDGLMKRTQNRPLPSGGIDPDSALSLGIGLSLGSVLTMGLAVNWVAAFWLAFTTVFYIGIYTILLKPRTVQNIVIGGLAGALPPVIGWASVMNETNLQAWSLCLIIFLWTPAHFWSLCLECGDDYAKAGIPMLPHVKGEKTAKKQIIVYAILTVLSTYLPYILGLVSGWYLVFATFLGGCFIALSIALFKGYAKAMLLFSFSIAYLFLVFISLLLTSIL